MNLDPSGNKSNIPATFGAIALLLLLISTPFSLPSIGTGSAVPSISYPSRSGLDADNDTRFSTGYVEDFHDSGSIDEANTSCTIRNDNGRAYLWASRPVFPAEYTGTRSIDTRSHGGGFSPKYNEYWYPSWSGSTIYRYDINRNYIGSFNSGQSSIMQVWGDLDGTYYTANWGNDRVYKWSDRGSSQQWSFHMGSTTGGVCCDENYVYALRWSHNQIRVLRKSDGQNIRNFNLPQSCYSYGSLACANGYLYVGGYAQDHYRVGIFDLDTEEYVGDFRCSQQINNMAFNGEEYCISPNSGTIYCYRISEGNAYGGEGSISPIDTAHVQSKVMDNTLEDIGAVQLNVTDHVPSGADITYRVTSDDLHWDVVLPGEPHALTYPGTILKWNATLHTDDLSIIPYIEEVKIDCDLVSSPELFEPGENSWQSEFYPTLSWDFTDPDPGDEQTEFNLEIHEDIEGAARVYDSGWIISSKTEHTVNSALGDGSYFWRARTRDSNGGASNFSAMRRLLIDITKPRGNLTIGDGAPSVNDRQVELHIEPCDSGSGVEEMQIIDDRGFEGTWEIFAETIQFSLSLGDGRKRVGLRLKDGAGQVSDTIVAYVYLDLIGPYDIEVSSTTHPDQEMHYSSRSPQFGWNAPLEVSGIKGYSYLMDQSVKTIPGAMSFRRDAGLAETEVDEFSGLSDGTWYFHIAACDIFEQWSNVTHYRINIDSAAPTIYDLAPDRTVWRNTTAVDVSGTVKDLGGSGLDLDRIEMSYRKADDPNYGTWSGTGLGKTVLEVDRNSVPLSARVSETLYLSEGVNYFRWRAFDLAGNGPAVSEAWMILVDTTPVIFSDIRPKDGSMFLDAVVRCGVTIDDDMGSGVDGWSVEYALSSGSNRPDSFTNWTSAELQGCESTMEIKLDIEFPPGMDNYIMWRAMDLAGTGYAYSDPVNVQVNSPPVPIIKSPCGIENYTAGETIGLDAKGTFDVDGDVLSYHWKIVDKRSKKRIMGVTGPQRDVVLEEGVFTVSLFVNDGKGYNESRKVDIWVSEASEDPSGGTTVVGTFFSEWWWLVMPLLVLITIVVFLVIMKYKKKSGGGVAPRPATPGPIGQGGSFPSFPASRPYQSGGYAPTFPGGYVAPERGTGPSLPGTPSRLALPSASHSHGPQAGVGAPQMPAAFRSSPQAQAMQQQSAIPPQRVAPAYGLPRFSTERGQQDLNTLALPPAPPTDVPPERPVTPQAVVYGAPPATFQSGVNVVGPAMPQSGIQTGGATSPQAEVYGAVPATLYSGVHGTGPSTLPPRIVQAGGVASPHPDMHTIDTDLEAIFDARGNTGPVNGTPPLPISPSPSSPPSPTFIKCHACGSLNPITTPERPIVIRCGTCGTEGCLAQ